MNSLIPSMLRFFDLMIFLYNTRSSFRRIRLIIHHISFHHIHFHEGLLLSVNVVSLRDLHLVHRLSFRIQDILYLVNEAIRSLLPDYYEYHQYNKYHILTILLLTLSFAQRVKHLPLLR